MFHLLRILASGSKWGEVLELLLYLALGYAWAQLTGAG